MNTAQWICETGAGYMFLSVLASIAVDRHYSRTRPHRWGPRTAGPNWRAWFWVPGYAAYVRRYHDQITENERTSEPVKWERRPRCPYCGLPHDLTPGSLPVKICSDTRIRIAKEKDRG